MELLKHYVVRVVSDYHNTTSINGMYQGLCYTDLYYTCYKDIKHYRDSNEEGLYIQISIQRKTVLLHNLINYKNDKKHGVAYKFVMNNLELLDNYVNGRLRGMQYRWDYDGVLDNITNHLYNR